MSYLTNEQITKIENNVRLLPIDDIDDISHYSFDSDIEEYNDFLKIAKVYCDINISKTFLLVHKETDELIAYITTSTDSIKLTPPSRQKT